VQMMLPLPFHGDKVHYLKKYKIIKLNT
jgi:hypothetical protein